MPVDNAMEDKLQTLQLQMNKLTETLKNEFCEKVKGTKIKMKEKENCIDKT